MRDRNSSPTASSYAARRLGRFSFIVWEEDWQRAVAFSAASRVSISEMLGVGGSSQSMRELSLAQLGLIW
jgi:hypothetical protein